MVTLFSDQALVTREANISVHKGLNEIFIGVDAFKVDSDSVSAKIFGKGELYSVQLKTIYLEKAPQENIKDLEKKLKDLKAVRTAMNGEINVLKKQGKVPCIVDPMSRLIFIKIKLPKVSDIFSGFKFFFLT
ncbi:MAG: DUF4140 domain-containing protein, partial [Desulfobacterales bacterium]